jgi:hypothetical protein
MKTLSLAIMALFLTACAPVYEVKPHYIAPTNPTGQSCVQNCSANKQTCNIEFQRKKETCKDRVRGETEKRFDSQMNEYNIKMKEYNALRKNYDREMASWNTKHIRLDTELKTYRGMCDRTKDKNSYECRKIKEVNAEIRTIDSVKPRSPSHPAKPTNVELEVIEAQEVCNIKSSCDTEYNNCFMSCGGKITYQKFCVENCKK